MEEIDLSQYLAISDYEKPKDYVFTNENFEELDRINKMLISCVDKDFNKFMLSTLLDYYVFFFENIGEFELLFIGFKELKRISQDETMYSKMEYKIFIKGLSENFDNLNNNLIREDLDNPHYYDVAFIGDIEQFKQSLNPPIASEDDFGLDLF